MIQGAGGKKKKQRKPKEEPNSLTSTAVAEVLDVVSEGEIAGLVDGLKSVYLDGTPLQNSDNTFNFKNVFVDTRVGTQAQTYIPRFSNLETTTVVNTEVTTATPVTRTVSNTAVNAVEIVLFTPALFEQKSNGDVVGTSVQVAVDLNSNGGGFVQKILHTITGKTNSKYQRAFVLGMTGSPPWQIRVRRITADSGVGTLQNDVFWDFYTEIVDLKLSMPNTALIGMSVDASQFDSVPVRAYDVRGIKVKHPNNYNPTTRVYTGSWGGAFTVGWTDNPAWCFYDMLTNKRYGAGNFVAETAVDKFELYAIAQYCDELVPNGRGGTEPRFTCNLYLQQQADAYEVLTNMASIFRGMLYWAAGTLIPVQDAPGTPVYLFTNANVVDGNFDWSGSGLNARHTVALVAWNDPSDFYQQKIEAVEDLDGIARYGVRETRTVAVGCTSRGQAYRCGKWLLDSERNETETVSFRTSMEAAMVQPGSLIEIADQHRAGRRYGGRIIAATTSQVQVDAELTDLPSGTFTLAVILPDGTEQERVVSSIAGRIVNVSAAFSAVPEAGSIWILIAPNLSPIAARIISISQDDDGTYSVTALRHDTTKYARVEQNLLVPPVPTTVKPITPGPVTSITLSTYTFSTDAINRRVLRVAWVDTQRNVLYKVSVRRDSGEWIEQPVTPGAVLDLYDVAPGVWEAQVTVINAINLNSAPVLSTALTISAGTDITGGAIGSPELGNNAVLDRSLANTNRDNLIPNPNSELGSVASGADPEGNGLVNDAVNSYNGVWCRRLTFATTASGIYLTKSTMAVPSVPDDGYYFEVYLKSSAALTAGTTVTLALRWANSAGAYAGTQQTVVLSSTQVTTTYRRFSVYGVVPAGHTGVWAYIQQQSVAGDAGKFLYIDALYMRRTLDSQQLSPIVRSSINSSFYCDFSDVSAWDAIGGALIDAPSSTFVAASDAAAQFGGSVGVATGQIARAWRDAIPFDPSVIYRMFVRIKQASDPASGTKLISVGVLSYANESDQLSSYIAAHWFVANATTQTVAAAYVGYAGYFRGRSGSGTTVVASDPANPGALPTTARYFRPVIVLGGNANVHTTGVQHIDEVMVETIANPGGWINTGNVVVDAISARVSAVTGDTFTLLSSNPAIDQVLTASITTTGGPVLVWVSMRLQSGAVAPTANVTISREIRRSGTTLKSLNTAWTFYPDHLNVERTMYSESLIDAPAAGSYSYTVHLQRSIDALNAGYASINLIVMELKR